MARLKMPSEAEMTATQKEVCAEAISGLRGKVPAPMIAWLRNPELARRTQRLGELLRYETTIEPHLSEMAILVCARHWTAHLEWTAHKALALKNGLDPQVAADIAARRVPNLGDGRARAVYDVAATLLTTGRLSDALYARAIEMLGEPGLVELVTIVGYYCLASFTLNTFQLGIPEAIAPELEDPEFAT
jgi:4-carboxymuconolactone decarboxylase